jgi:hypothetical protein
MDSRRPSPLPKRSPMTRTWRIIANPTAGSESNMFCFHGFNCSHLSNNISKGTSRPSSVDLKPSTCKGGPPISYAPASSICQTSTAPSHTITRQPLRKLLVIMVPEQSLERNLSLPLVLSVTSIPPGLLNPPKPPLFIPLKHPRNLHLAPLGILLALK